MAAKIEARSLARVVDLAENPPEHLLPQTRQHVQEALVLYIARVPGSKDVFLTTMKPQEKVVTAQDIQSCLYYLHVDGGEEDRFRMSEESKDDDVPTRNDQKSAQINDMHASALSAPGKTLPGGRQVAPIDRPELPPKTYPHFQPPTCGPRGNTHPGRKPVAQSRRYGQMKGDRAPALPPRQVLSPRPLQSRLYSVDNAALGDASYRKNVDLRGWSEQPGLASQHFPPSVYSSKQESLDIMYSKNFARYPEAPFPVNGDVSQRNGLQDRGQRDLLSENSGTFAPGIAENEESTSSLTLIRRYNTFQSNVGKISTKERSAVLGADNELSIEISTTGYLKFTNQHHLRVQEAQFSDRTSPRSSDSHSSNAIDASDVNVQEGVMFQRHLQHFSNLRRPVQSLRTESYDSSLGQRLSSTSFDDRRHSHQTPGNFDRDILKQADYPNSANSKGYSFQSPWNGICEFTTGTTGRSLKCRHIKRSDHQDHGDKQSAPVSELRFNLPSSKAFGSPAPKSPQPGTPRRSKRSSFFSSHHKRGSLSSAEDYNKGDLQLEIERHDRLDLSLGQEHAGGGFGGKQAKLGKLIVENEGLQMLDLVVASNMALWWKVYDRIK